MTKPAKSFDEICRNASTAFLQTVVVIDNEAVLHSDKLPETPAKTATKKGRPASAGAKVQQSADMPPRRADAGSPDGDADRDPKAHTLDLNKVSRAFAEQKLTCGVYLPSDRDPQDRETLIRETVAAIHPTDSCVLDWQLREGDASPAIEAIKQVLQNDQGEGGRLRLILVYTAEDLTTASKQLVKALEELGRKVNLEDSDGAPVITGDHFRIAFANKPTLGRNPVDDGAVIAWDGLPAKIISEFTTLSRGLLRAFALQSVAAVRRDMHRILAQFDEELDPVYAGDRATKPDQADALALIAEILNSELAHTVLHSTAARDCLTEAGVLPWLDHIEGMEFFRDDPKGFKAGNKEYQRLDRDARKELLKDREPATVWLKNDKHAINIRSKLFPDDGSSTTASVKLAALSTLARAIEPTSLPASSIRLGFGTIVRLEPEVAESSDAPPAEEEVPAQHEASPPTPEVYVCIQPACESARIAGDGRPFLFVRLISDEDTFELVTPNGDGFSRWRMPKRDERHFRTVPFQASDGSDRVCGQVSSESDWLHFVDTAGQKWSWIADLRELTAITIRDSALEPLAGVGLNGLEWLRLRAKR